MDRLTGYQNANLCVLYRVNTRQFQLHIKVPQRVHEDVNERQIQHQAMPSAIFCLETTPKCNILRSAQVYAVFYIVIFVQCLSWCVVCKFCLLEMDSGRSLLNKSSPLAFCALEYWILSMTLDLLFGSCISDGDNLRRGCSSTGTAKRLLAWTLRRWCFGDSSLVPLAKTAGHPFRRCLCTFKDFVYS